MKIVRPYGFSRTPRDGETLVRKLVETSAAKSGSTVDIPTFASRKSQLVIGQWISLIDKIAAKPSGTSKPTEDQRAFRQRLGEACWQRLCAMKAQYLPEAVKKEDISRICDLWWSRIHPYLEGTREAKSDRAARPPAVKGRFYKVFAGDADPAEVCVAMIAGKIEAKLYGDDGRDGLIAARAKSIKGNVLRMRTVDETDSNGSSSAADIAAYLAPGDPASLIRAKAQEIERARGRMTHGAAAAILHEHWGKVFLGDDGAVLNVDQARNNCAGMFALHERLRLCYRGILKRTRKDTGTHRKEAKEQAKSSPRLSVLLPRNLPEALGLAGERDRNAEVGALVRLGRIIHYAAPRDVGTADRPAYTVENWPVGWKDSGAAPDHWLRDVDRSDYWTSDGQAEIKRAEAFVRLWRQALSLARLTLTDWVSMRGPFEKDILGGSQQPKDALKPDLFERAVFDRKLRLLFGLHADTFAFDDDAHCREFLHNVIGGAASLRHAAFHFKGREDLLAALTILPDKMRTTAEGGRNEIAMTAAATLWDADARGRVAQLREILAGARANDYLTQAQADQVLPLLAGATAAELPLPRFSRILRRRENAWKTCEFRLKFPDAPNRTTLEAKPERRCQYTIMKLVYERPFRVWLAVRDPNAVKAWIDRAVDRADLAARTLHGQGKPDAARALIVARADRLRGFAPAGDARDAIKRFFAELSRESASEMRIQRGYESDAGKAREQAEYIEDLLCDVVLLAFDGYLNKAALGWLRAIAEKHALPCDLPATEPTADDLAAEDWQKALYLILHLIPVESVGQLMHQLVRWDVAAGGRDEDFPEAERTRLDALFAAMTLYLDMHDAKFTGGMALAGCEDFKQLFASGAEGFRKIFPEVLDEETDLRIPRRGLRQIARFGHLPLIKTLCGDAKIEDATIDWVMAMGAKPAGKQSKIAKWHSRREELHAELAPQKKQDWPEKNKTGLYDALQYAYCATIMAEHREASNFVNLVDHVRVHRIVMAIWSRLVDYAGLFERDLYFVTLGLLHRRGMAPAELLTCDGKDLLEMGQAISALAPRSRQNTPETQGIFEIINRLFGQIWEGNAPLNRIRNTLAHLDLRGRAADPAPRLTDRINDARRLMAYDRKMKNAVTKSVIDRMEDEGVKLFWSISSGDAGHKLTDAVLSPRAISHLGGRKLPIRGGDRKRELLTERLLSHACVRMLAAAFGGSAKQVESIVEMIDRFEKND